MWEGVQGCSGGVSWVGTGWMDLDRHEQHGMGWILKQGCGETGERGCEGEKKLIQTSIERRMDERYLVD